MDLNRDFSEFIACCIARDLDVRVWLDAANAEHLIAALQDFGFGSLGLTAADFGEPDVVVQLGHAPHRIDPLTSIDGVEFDDCWRHRVEVDVAGTAVPFIDVDHLVDLADAAALTDVGSQE
jgi:hypothetical protein